VDTPIPPSGDQVGVGPAVAVTLGGGLRAAPGLDGYDGDALPAGARGQVLAPWPNRLDRGRWSWRGRQLQLPVSEPGRDTAIHGLVRWAEWRVAERGPDRARFEHVLAPQPGYPFRLALATTYAWSAGELTVTVAATNLAAEPAPFGAGQHPYLTAGTALVDAAELTVDASSELISDERGLPTGERGSDGWHGRIGAARLDTTYGRLARNGDGRATVVLRGPERTTTLWADGAWRWLQVFTGDTLAEGRRRQGLAVEPLSCPPNALASGRDLVVMEPGETWSGSWGLRSA